MAVEAEDEDAVQGEILAVEEVMLDEGTQLLARGVDVVHLLLALPEGE